MSTTNHICSVEFEMMTDGELSIPVNDGTRIFKSGNFCSSRRSSAASNESWSDCENCGQFSGSGAETKDEDFNANVGDCKTLMPPRYSVKAGNASKESSGRNVVSKNNRTKNVESKALQKSTSKKLPKVTSSRSLTDDCSEAVSSGSMGVRTKTFSCCLSDITSCAGSFDTTRIEISYNTGCAEEDSRLRKLHYAALEIYVIEKNFINDLEILAVKYPAYLAEYGKQHETDLLSSQRGGKPHRISRIAVQLQMVKEAHKCLFEKIATNVMNWDSRNPNMAECFKNGAAFLRFCLPYLKEKQEHVDELKRLFQGNDKLARATSEFEKKEMNKISVVQQLDVVHQNLVRYAILLEAYKKYLLPECKELGVCDEALIELTKVSKSIDRQISVAEMDKRLIDLYRRLEGRFNVFEVTRHLLLDGELTKQSRKDLQPRYLILFSDFLLICKYSPTLRADANFRSNFYKFPISRIHVKAEEHKETKRERDEWVKRINEAKKEEKEVRRCKIAASKILNISKLHQESAVTETPPDTVSSKTDADASPSHGPVSEKYTPLWIPDPKATSCMMPGCCTKFNILNRRHHCRRCGILICYSCVGYAPVKSDDRYVRDKVCPDCYVKITEKRGDQFAPSFFTRPENKFLSKANIPARNAEGVLTGTVCLRNQKGAETVKWGRITTHEDGILELYFYNAEFDVEPVSHYSLIGYTLNVQELGGGSRLFELHQTDQADDKNATSIQFRIAHPKNAESWYKFMKSALEGDSMAGNSES